MSPLWVEVKFSHLGNRLVIPRAAIWSSLPPSLSSVWSSLPPSPAERLVAPQASSGWSASLGWAPVWSSLGYLGCRPSAPVFLNNPVDLILGQCLVAPLPLPLVNIAPPSGHKKRADVCLVTLVQSSALCRMEDFG